jgi:hypothetical protein
MINVQSESLEFPDFCVGTPHEGRRLITVLATTLAEEYRATHVFRELKTVRVEVGTIVFTESELDLAAGKGIRIYLTQELLAAIQCALSWVESDKVKVAYETTIRRSCWGILAVVVGRQHPKDIQDLRSIIEAVESCWPGLDNLKYVDQPGKPVSLSSVLQARFSGLLAMWARHTTGDVIPDLLAALAALEAASDDDRVDVAAVRLGQLAAKNKRIRHKKELTSVPMLRQRLVELDQEERNSIELGSDMAARTLLYALDRELWAAAP